MLVNFLACCKKIQKPKSTRLFVFEKDRYQKCKYQIWIMSIIFFGNPDVILLFRVKTSVFRRVSYFLGTDVIFNASPTFRDRR